MGLFRRQRKPFTAVVMACWLFALFVSVAHACGFDADQSDATRAMTMSSNGGGTENAPPGCDKFCADDLPVLAKIKSVQYQSSAQVLFISPLSVAPARVANSRAAMPLRSAHPPAPVVASLNIRFVRLAL
jgi:hypothetical protein